MSKYISYSYTHAYSIPGRFTQGVCVRTTRREFTVTAVKQASIMFNGALELLVNVRKKICVLQIKYVA